MALEINKIYCADCLEKMKEMPDNNVDHFLKAQERIDKEQAERGRC